MGGLILGFVNFCRLGGKKWGRGGGGGFKGKITPRNWRKMILFERSYLSIWLLKSQNNDNAGIATQVDLKTSTPKPLHANWVINTHNLILNDQN